MTRDERGHDPRRAAAAALAPGALRGRRAVVMGLGRFGGGSGAARHLARAGARVVATDLRGPDELPEARAALADAGVELVLGEHRAADFDAADLVVANPAVPPDAPLLARARRAGARVTTEVELFLAAAPCRLVGVTGTQGKSSTTAFAAQLLAATGLTARAAGNLGGSPLDALAELRGDEVVVLELSSYQLEGLGRPPALARDLEALCVTNVGLDHLERHGGPAGYAAAKHRLFELSGPDTVAVLPAGPGPCAAWGLARTRRFDPEASAGPLELPLDGRRRVLPGPRDLGLPAFQAANLRAALLVADALGRGSAAAEVLGAGAWRPQAPPHRLERLADLFGARAWDNGVATTPDATAAALRALGGPVVLVAGGRAKDLPTPPLLEAARGRVRAAATFGEAAGELAALLRGAGADAHAHASLEAAVERAVAALRPGEDLLFSPGCASFDTHPNFRERAHAFRRTLEGLRAASEEGARGLSSRGRSTGGRGSGGAASGGSEPATR